MNITINSGSEGEVAVKPTIKVEFKGKDGKDADILAIKTLRDELIHRLTIHESLILINAQTILLKVSQQDFDDLGSRIGNAETSIGLNAHAITLKASQSLVDALTGRVSSAETLIVQTAQSISLKASKTDVDNLTNRLSIAESSFIQAAGSISMKVSLQTFNELNQIVASQQTLINQTATSISLLATKETTDALTGRLTSAEASISVNANEILSKVSVSVFNALGERVNSYDTIISQTAEAITSLATKSTTDALNSRVTSNETSIAQNASEISLKASTAVVNSLGQQLSAAESQIAVNAQQIALRVTAETFNVLGSRVSQTEADIAVNAQQISLKVSTQTFNALGERMSSAESSISQNALAITSKVSIQNFNGETLVSMINQTASSIKISAKNLNLDGAISFSYLDSELITINALVDGVPDKALKVKHDNGVDAFIFTRKNGKAVMEIYNDNGVKVADLDTIRTSGGIVYVNSVPESWLQFGLRYTNINSPTLTQAQIDSIAGSIQGWACAGFGDTSIAITRSMAAYSYSAGTTGNDQYEGYHTSESKSTTNFIADGWYIFANYVQNTGGVKPYRVQVAHFVSGKVVGDGLTIDVYLNRNAMNACPNPL